MNPTSAQLRTHEHRITRMLADHDLLGDLLLVGIVFARSIDLDDPPLPTVVKAAAEMLYGNRHHAQQLHGNPGRDENGEHYPRIATHGVRRVRDILRSDILRYVPDMSRAFTCQRPVNRSAARIERVGEICGRNADHGTVRPIFVDPVDGTRHALGACGQVRCRAWWQALLDRNRVEVETNPPPAPVANWGGVLERHLDEIDWPALYAHLDSSWKPPHEVPGWRAPKLQIVLNDDPEPVVVARPALSVVKGGWR